MISTRPERVPGREDDWELALGWDSRLLILIKRGKRGYPICIQTGDTPVQLGDNLSRLSIMTVAEEAKLPNLQLGHLAEDMEQPQKRKVMIANIGILWANAYLLLV